jgi:hypothetical protein
MRELFIVILMLLAALSAVPLAYTLGDWFILTLPFYLGVGWKADDMFNKLFNK